MNSDDLSSTGFSSVLENLNKKTGSNYCAICDIKTKSRTSFISHIRGLRHQSQLRVIETVGFGNWTKTEAKKVKRNIRQVGQSEKSARRIRRSRCRHKASPQSKRSQGAQSKAKKQKVRTINEKERDDRKLSSPDYSHLREAFHSEILNDSKNSSVVVKTPCVVPLDSNQTENLSISPFSSYSEMERRGNFRVPPRDSLLPLPHFNSRHSSPNFQDGMPDSRPQYWHQFPPRANYQGRYQPQYGRGARPFPPAGFLPFKQQNGRRGVKPGDGTLTKSKGSTKGGLQNEVGGQARSFLLSNEGHGNERNSQTPRSSRNPKSYHKSNDGYSRHENFSNKTDPHLEASLNTQLYPFFQPVQDETAYPYNAKDSRRGVQSEHEHRRSSYSPSESEKRRSAERQRDSGNETSGSRRRSNPRSSDDTRGRYDSFGNDTEARSFRGAGNEKAWPKHTEKSVECLRTNQSRKKEDGEQSSKTNGNVSRKSTSDGKSSDCDKTKAQPSKSDNLATPKSPTFSNVAMQRMNARLHSFTKYGKMPTSGQIRNLAVSASPAQEKRDGKLQEWSRKIESHHNLTAQDKELINRLVNYSCSRREQKKLEFCLREHARSRKKLTLPRFNLQLSGMEDCKEPSGVDDSVNSMVTEVVDCLPEDVLNSLINALNSDVDEYVAVNLPLSPDAEERKGVCISSNLKSGSKRVDDVFITVDEVGGNSSCDETADCPVQLHTSSANSHITSCHSGEIVRRLSLPNDQNHESSNTVAVHSSPVKATEQLARGSSLEICESQEVPNKNNPEADQQQMVCVDVKVKEKLFEVQARNIEKCPDYDKLGQCRENKNVVGTHSSGNSVKTLAGLENSSIQVKKEQPDSQMTDFEIIELSPVKSQSSSMLPSLTRVNSVEELTNGHMSVKQGMPCPNVSPEVITLEGNSNDRTAVVCTTLSFNRNKYGLDSTVKNLSLPSENIRPFPGLSYILRPLHKSVEQPVENRTGPAQVNKPQNFGSMFNPPSLDHRHVQGGADAFQAVGNQQFECSSDSPAAVAATPVIKIEHSSDDAPNGDAEGNEFFLPKISSVTSIRGSENFMGNNSLPLAACLETSLKQEPVSPAKVTVVTLSGNDEEGSELNCSEAKVRMASATELSVSTPIPNNSSHSRGLHNAAAASFPSVIHRVSSLSQKEDAERISEVSSSTGILIDEVQSSSLGLPDNVHPVGRNEGASSDLIRELLSITSSEEKLVRQASEAERKIAELTASLEEWKRKKYEIEHKQIKLRMKRQELLLLNAAKGFIPRDKYGKACFHSAANDRISECGSDSDEGKGSVASMQSASTLSLEKSASDSDSSCSQSLNRKCCNNVSNFRKKKKKMNPKICGKGPNVRNKRTADDDDLSDSSIGFTNKRLRKHRSCSRSSLTGGRCSSSDKSTHKNQCLDRSPQVVLQPVQLSSGGGGGKTVVNNNDDIIVLEDSPSRSLASTEEDSNSEDGSVIIQEEVVDSVTSQEDIIAPTPDTTVNIGTLFAHDGAVIDLKVYDCYLYSCSLDCSAKRFSLFDPTNDKTSYEGHQKTVTSICLSPRKEVYTTSLDTYLRCFVAKTGIIVDTFEMKSSIICSCTGSGMLYLGLNSGGVLFFSFKTKKVMYELKIGNCCISQLATATQGAQRLLCVVANDGIVSLYDTTTRLLLRCLETHVRPPCCVQICNDSVYITTSEKAIVIHSLLSGKLVRMVNWAASATGLEIIDNYILSSSFDGLIRCHDINQDMVSHSIYYGAGNAMVMSMTAYKNWVFTGNRKGTIEAFKFDPSKQLACQYGRCRLKYGRECDVLHHVTIDHLPCVNLKTKKCPWTGCAHEFTPRTTIEGKQEHVKEHVICTYEFSYK